MVLARRSDYATNPNGDANSSEWYYVLLGISRPVYMGCTCAWSPGIGRVVPGQVIKRCNHGTYPPEITPRIASEALAMRSAAYHELE
jgi:hypothetical protein